MMACSEIGVDLTRSSPNLVDRPLVTPITPPSCLSPTSSPRARTLGSAAMASLMARLIAWTKFSFSVPVIAPSHNIMREHVALEFENVRVCGRVGRFYRSEEHKSELQSLMRISYAVFCLKKKKKLNLHQPQQH